MNREEERTVKELCSSSDTYGTARLSESCDAASTKLEAEANKLDAEARKLEAEVRSLDQTTNTDAFKLGLAAFATILAAVKVADALGWL